MSKTFAAIGMAALLSAAAIVPAAQADSYRGHGHGYGNHHAYNGGHHRGRGHWHNGRWIALGVLGAVAAGAAAESYDDCYWRRGVRYCD